MEHNPIIAGGAAYLAVKIGNGWPNKKQVKEFFAKIGLRPCPCCSYLKAAADFYIDANNGGLSSKCKQCKYGTIKSYRANNPNTLKESQKKYYETNKPRIMARIGAYMNQRYAGDSLFRLSCIAKGLVRKSLKRGGYSKRSRTHEILGCDFQTFHAHIERQFTKGMTWDKVGPEIHIDHITPLATAKTEEDVLALNHYTNLRPCWAEENMRKRGNIEFLI